MSTQIGDLLVKKNLITTEQLREAEKKSHENGETVTYNIISLGYVDEHR